MSDIRHSLNGRHRELPAIARTVLMKRAAEIAADTREYPMSLEGGIPARIEIMGMPETEHTVIFVICRPRNVLPSAAEIQRAYPLTPRETEVALLMASGESDKQIARELGVSTACASRHAEKVRAKMGIRSRRHVRGLLDEITAMGQLEKKAS